MRKGLKIILYIICSILLLVLVAVVYLNTQWGQNFVRTRAEAYLKNKLKTDVRIGHLGYGLPKYIVLNDVLFLDENKDTLLSAGELKIDLAMLKLIHKKIEVQELIFKGIHSHIYRNRTDTTYNFSYIIAAFTGNQPKDTSRPNGTTSSPLQIDLDRVKFDDVHVRFDDYAGGIRFSVGLDHLDLKMKNLDLDKMLFHIKDLTIAGLHATFSQDTSYLPLKRNDTAKTKLGLIADNVDLQNIAFQYDDALHKFLFGLKLGQAQLQLNKFGLSDDIIDVKKLVLNKTDIVLTMGALSTAPAFVDTLIKIDTTAGWHIKARDVAIADVNFKMDDNSSPRQKTGIDYAHLYFQNAALTMHDLLYTSDTIAGDIEHFSGTEQCGLNVKELKTNFHYDPQGAVLHNLYLRTPGTILQDHIEVHYPSITVLQKRTQTLQLILDIKNSTVSVPDVLLFAPQLKDQAIFNKFRNASIKVEAAITGRLDNLNITHFYAAGLSNTEVLLNGRFSGLPDSKNLSYNLHITRFVSSRKDISLFVPDSVLSSIRLPDKFGAMGQIAGTEMDYNTDMLFVSTDGRAYVKGQLSMSAGKNKEHYDVFVKADNLNIGHILKKDSLMGAVSANIKVKGESFDVKTMIAAIDADVSGAEIKGYNYHDIKMHAKIAAQVGNIDFISVDSNLQVQLTGQADFSGKYASAKADIRIDSIDFRALKLYNTELRARGLVHFDFPVLNPDYPKGEFMWWQPVINADGRRYYLDSLYVISRPSADTGQNIIANLDVMQASITGKTPLTKIIPIIEEHINRHYKFQSSDSIKNSIAAEKKKIADTVQLPAEYSLKILAHVIDKPMLHGIFPGLTSFDSIHIDGALSPQYLTLNVNAPNLVYSSTSIENGKISVSGADSAFTYKITVDKITQNNMALWYANIHGNLDKDKITANISLSDEAKKERFAIAATLQSTGDSQVIQLQSGLKLNYKTWTVAQPNRIVIAKGAFYVQNFEVSDSGQYIKANSDAAHINAPLKIDFTHFLLSNITDVISHNDTLIADGVIDGNITIQQMTPVMQLTSDLQIHGLCILGDTLGDLVAQVNNKQENILDTKVTLKGQGNDITLNGSYYLKQNDGSDFNFDLAVNALALRSFETIAQNQIRNSSGYIKGKLAVKGTLTAPQITGTLRTDNLVTTVSQLNATFKMPSEAIEFANTAISFNNFTIHDSADNKAVFNGDINIADLSDIKLDMKVAAKNWMAINSTKKDNGTFYGKLLLTTDLAITGSPTAPSIDGDLKILKGTNVTVVNPETTPEMQDSKGIVVFVNMKDTGRGNYLVAQKKDTVTHKMAVGADFNVNITVDKSAQFSLIIDQSSGDFFSVQGDATLNAAVNPGGTISLTGSYELHGGSYQMNYNFIKRKFNIKDGSTITFAGDPITGTMLDVTAVYEVQAPPYDLIQQEVTDPTQLNYYKQQLPFQVDLHMNGEVMKPRFTFDIELPENKVHPLSADQIELVQGRLSQVRADTSELNKQVFAVLILSRFVSDDPFNSAASSSTAFIAMQSVSTFIGEQLNQAAGKFIKGVDFSVNLAETEDYTSGNMQQRTDLNLAASKQLLNNRLKLTIGNDFELQGPQTNNAPSSALPSNLAADYLLTADGKYSMRAYRKVYDEGVLEGFVTETGLDFIVNLNFNHFKDVFIKMKPEKTDTTK